MLESKKYSLPQTNHKLLDVIAVDPEKATKKEIYKALSLVAREQLARRWVATQKEDTNNKARRVYYLSMEFLIGRTLSNALAATGLHDKADEAFQEVSGVALDDILECEPDAGLGNGGLGRLAACFLDSMATLELPSWGYGLRYEYGIFAQSILNGEQIEKPDNWLMNGTPWEFPRCNTRYDVNFGGMVKYDGDIATWLPQETAQAQAFDYVIPGHGTNRVSTLRLWKSLSQTGIDLNAFNNGEYSKAAEDKNHFESISWVLYPNDSTQEGRELRLRQEYFFVAASIQDIIDRHLKEHSSLDNLSDKVAIHLNDTHPTIAIAELMRCLYDVHKMPWRDAWLQCKKIFSYTNHTLMPEALETWPVSLMTKLLPRHMHIIYQINSEFLSEVFKKFPNDPALIRSVSLIDDGDWSEESKRVRMANLCIVASHRVNGVSALHSDLMVETIFKDFAKIWPEKFHNKTNGITPRRWLSQCNPGLSALLDEYIDGDWRRNLNYISQINEINDSVFEEKYTDIKHENKVRLTKYIQKKTGVIVSPDSMFDVHVKRIHEYKRQLLNVLHVISRYNMIINGDGGDLAPRVVIFAGKAASAYVMAKSIIRLINDIANVVNNDPRVGDKLKVVFLPNYSVSLAELIIPAADLSEQISTAGTEASGTGNMKLALNGALTIGTLDGANIEILENVGDDNIFIFGNNTSEVAELQKRGYDPKSYYNSNPVLRQALNMIRDGYFSQSNPARYVDIFNSLVNWGDHYMLLADFDDYLQTQLKVDAAYLDKSKWTKMSLANVANMADFSSDRTIAEYAIDTWKMSK